MSQNLDATIRKIFYNVQFSKTCHKENLKKLKKCYDRNEESKFLESFLSCLRVTLTFGQRHPHIENTLSFVTSFAATFYTFEDDENDTLPDMCPFLVTLFDFLLNNHNAKDTSVRFRICNFLNLMLNSLGERAYIDDKLCDKITNAMMECLLDRSPRVRAQTVFALHRLQDPMDEQCPIIKMYIFHVCKDPSAEVRKAVLLCMGKNQRTLLIALRKTRDIDEMVRKAAYEFISKVTVKSLSIKQRDQLLHDGLKDRSDIVKKCVEYTLLSAWLRHFKGNFIDLINALDVEIGTDASILALNSLFKDSSISDLLEQVSVDKKTKLIPINDLSSEYALYWNCLVKYLHSISCVEELETILPDLSAFCAYISDFQALMSSKQYEEWEQHTHNFILLQLYEIAITYDLSDEVGRKNLHTEICNTLLSDHCSEKITERIVTHLVQITPDLNTRLENLTNIINDIISPSKEPEVVPMSEEQQHEINMKRARLKVQLLELKEEEYQAIQNKRYLEAEDIKNRVAALNEEITNLTSKEPAVIDYPRVEEKNDANTICKCLNILCTIMQSVTTLPHQLTDYLKMALDNLDHPDSRVHKLSLKTLSLYGILDKELAKKNIMIFVLQFSLDQENNKESWITALKGIFDLLLLYGLKHFDIAENEEPPTNKRNENRGVRLFTDTQDDLSIMTTSNRSVQDEGSCNFIKILAQLLDNVNEDLRTIAAEGLCKLLLMRKLANSKILSKLIILCYNPLNDNDFCLRQCVTYFFNNFTIDVPESQDMLEEAYLLTLRVICDAPDTSPLQEINLHDISRFMLSLMIQRVRKSDGVICCAHNSLVFDILAEILNVFSVIDQETLIKSLQYLHITIEDKLEKKRLFETLEKISEMLKECNKRLVKYIELFQAKINSPDATEEVVENEDEVDKD